MRHGNTGSQGSQSAENCCICWLLVWNTHSFSLHLPVRKFVLHDTCKKLRAWEAAKTIPWVCVLLDVGSDFVGSLWQEDMLVFSLHVCVCVRACVQAKSLHQGHMNMSKRKIIYIKKNHDQPLVRSLSLQFLWLNRPNSWIKYHNRLYQLQITV